MKLQSIEFEPRWDLTAKFHPNRSTGSGLTGEDTGRQQTDNKQTTTLTDNKGRLELSGAREPITVSFIYST